MKDLWTYLCEAKRTKYPLYDKMVQAAKELDMHVVPSKSERKQLGEILRANIDSDINNVPSKIKQIIVTALGTKTGFSIGQPVNNTKISGKYKPYPITIGGKEYFIVNSLINNGIRFEDELSNAFNKLGEESSFNNSDLQQIIDGFSKYCSERLMLDGKNTPLTLKSEKVGTRQTSRGFDLKTVSVPGGNIGSIIADLKITANDKLVEYLSLKNGRSHICNYRLDSLLRAAKSDNYATYKEFFKKLGADGEKVLAGLNSYKPKNENKEGTAKTTGNYIEINDSTCKDLWAELINNTIGEGYWYCNLKHYDGKPVLFKIEEQPKLHKVTKLQVKYPTESCKTVYFKVQLEGIEELVHVEIRNTNGELYPNQFMIDMDSEQLMKYCNKENYLD